MAGQDLPRGTSGGAGGTTHRYWLGEEPGRPSGPEHCRTDSQNLARLLFSFAYHSSCFVLLIQLCTYFTGDGAIKPAL